MKILYAIQGTGNGHLSRARDIIPALQKKGDVDILISGTQVDVTLPFPIKYRFKGMGFIFGKNGGIDLLETYKKSNLKRFYKEIKSLPVNEYDLVISDFEPVSAWSCRLHNKICIGLSHQSAVINKNSPKPKEKDMVGKAILKNYAPVSVEYGFHFISYDTNIFTPVIRSEIRNAAIENKDHYSVYLPSYSDKKLIAFLSQIKEVQWQVFSKHSSSRYSELNVSIQPIENELFVKSLVSCSGILCGAGFETPAEALFLNKKLMVIPMKGQYEQQCNASALKKMGVQVIKNLKDKNLGKVEQWAIHKSEQPKVNYSDLTNIIISKIIDEQFHYPSLPKTIILGKKPHSVNKLKKLTLIKILSKISA